MTTDRTPIMCVKIPEFPFPGGLSQADHWLAASARLDAGYLPGGSNTRQTLAKLCRSVAHELDETAVEPTISPYGPQWRVFDKDDESTWPSEKYKAHWTHVISPSSGDSVAVTTSEWHGEGSLFYWSNVAHWMPIEVPEPPQ